MTECLLAVVDVSGIQDYVFASNRLRDAVGGSELVARATGSWVVEALDRKWQTNIDQNTIDSDRTFETDNLDVELLYSGGGNALLLFRRDEQYVDWAGRLSKRVLQDAPGLRVAIARSERFSWNADGDDLKDRIGKLFTGPLANSKRSGLRSSPLLGLGVTAACALTGLPAVAVDGDSGTLPLSANIAARRKVLPDAEKRFQKLLSAYVSHRDKKTGSLGFRLANDFDDLGRTHGESSYLAVVHADGNGMGQRFLKAWQQPTNRKAIQAVRTLSAAVNRAGEQALLTALAGLITPEGELVAPYDQQNDQQKYLPVRPIIYGGDDITFVCDGRIGLELAARYLAAFEAETAQLPGGGGKATARAGIAIVKSHYPFRRAYDMSEELVKSAKQMVSTETSALDWHIAASGLLGDLDQIRRREYGLPAGKTLSLRPLPLRDLHNSWRSWPQVREVVRALQGDEWSIRRNKVKALREALRDGPEQTSQFLKVYRLSQLPGYSDAAKRLRETGFDGEICGYFDPIELTDFFIALPEMTA